MKRVCLASIVWLWILHFPAMGAQIPSDWAQSAVEQAQALEIFDPNEVKDYGHKVTRQEFVRLLMLLVEKKIPDTLKADGSVFQNHFTDTNDVYVLRAAEYGIISGFSSRQGNVFQPDKTLTRSEAAVMLHQSINYLETALQQQLLINDRSTMIFEDEVPSWAIEAAASLSMNGIMVGMEGKFYPYDLITLEEGLSIVMRTAAFLPDSPYRVQVSYLSYQGFLTPMASAELLNYGKLPREFLFSHPQGGYTILTHEESKHELLVTIFNQDFQMTEQKRIAKELPLLADVYQSQAGDFYVLMGQENWTEDPLVEVIRVVKFSPSWERLGSTTILAGACITRTPFLGAAPDMTDNGTTLVIHTSRERFMTPEDGVNHQSNLTLKINMADMSLPYISPPFPENHVSHSFHQFVAYQGSDLIYFDHGDGYPRALYIQKEAPGTMYKNIGQRLPGTEVFPLYGEFGDNYTGVTPGGLAQGPNGILAVANATLQTEQEVESATRNALLLRAGNHLEETSSQWLTAYPSGASTTVGVPYLIEIGYDRYVVMWNTFVAQSYASTDYVIVDSFGQFLSGVQKLYQVPLGETAPLYQAGKLIWFLGDKKFTVYRLLL